jgi:hypothetical protein
VDARLVQDISTSNGPPLVNLMTGPTGDVSFVGEFQSVPLPPATVGPTPGATRQLHQINVLER